MACLSKVFSKRTILNRALHLVWRPSSIIWFWHIFFKKKDLDMAKIAQSIFYPLVVSIFLTTVYPCLAQTERENKCTLVLETNTAINNPLISDLPKRFGVDDANTVGWIQTAVSENDLRQEAAAILLKQPWSNEKGSVSGQAWMRSKNELLEWDSPLTQKVINQLMQVAAIREKFEATPSTDIYVVLIVEQTHSGQTSRNNTPAWHGDGNTFTPTNKNLQSQVLVTLYEQESNPTEFITSSNSLALFEKLEAIRKPAKSKMREADALINSWPDLQTIRLRSGQILMTTSDAVHRRTIADRTAWRFFLRINFYRP